MSRHKKRVIIALIYIMMLAVCAGVIYLLDRLSSVDEEIPPTETSFMESSQTDDTEPPETDGNETKEAETEAVYTYKPSRKKTVLKYTEENQVPAAPVEEIEPPAPPVVVIASDTHYYPPELTDYGEAFETALSRDDGKTAPYMSQVLDAFFEEVLELKPTVLVLSGDLTLNGERAGHEELAGKLASLEEKGVKVLVIPGNHDINNPMASSYFGKTEAKVEQVNAAGFYEIYRQFGYDQAISRDESSLSYLYPLDSQNWLLMLDSCQYEPRNLVGGRIREETLSWMKTQLDAAEEAGITVVPVAHHNLLKESSLYPDDCTLENSAEVIRLLEAYKLPVYLSGHLHLQRVKKYKAEPGEAADLYHISEIVSDSLALYPSQYGVLSWTENNRLQYRTKEIDVSGWAARSGQTDENLLNFERYGEDTLMEVVGAKVYKKIGENLPEDQRRDMARLYASLNRAYCAGTPVDLQEVKTSPAYKLWERNLPDSVLFMEIQDILRDTRQDNNSWEQHPD